MDKERVKGKMEDMAGRAERQAGEWTGNKKAREEGLKHQEPKREHDEDRDIDREKGAA